mmetsp:Transcript_21951/g.36762  ORF Transcript_21951/g.36762 Transcript_21951/m.36762 type:complete len:90 (+) Transcript_21951:94-363(+)
MSRIVLHRAQQWKKVQYCIEQGQGHSMHDCTAGVPIRSTFLYYKTPHFLPSTHPSAYSCLLIVHTSTIKDGSWINSILRISLPFSEWQP